MSGYIGTQPVPQATQHRETFTATTGQTSFATAGYTPQFLDVFLNGIHLLNPEDYTASNGSDVVLTTGAALDDVLEVISYSPFEVANQTFTGDTSTDNLSVTGSFTSKGIDDNATSTAMTLDASGNLLVGTATSADSTFSVQMNGSGGRISAATGLNSNSFRFANTNNTSEWSLGTNSPGVENAGDYLAVGRFPNGGAWSEAMRVTADGNLLVGGTTSPSGSGQIVATGGVYLGGTGSANHLDDYEEGTFTVYIIDGSNNPQAGYSYGDQAGSYTKIGNMVNVRIVMGTGNSVSNGDGVYFNLPFAVSNAHQSAYASVAPLTRYLNFGTDQYPIVEVSRGTSRMVLLKCTSFNTTALVTNNDLGTAFNLNVSLSYQAA